MAKSTLRRCKRTERLRHKDLFPPANPDLLVHSTRPTRVPPPVRWTAHPQHIREIRANDENVLPPWPAAARHGHRDARRQRGGPQHDTGDTVRRQIVLGFSQVGARAGRRRTPPRSRRRGSTAASRAEVRRRTAKQENQSRRPQLIQKVECRLSPWWESGWDTVLKEAKDRRHPGHPDRPARRPATVALQDSSARTSSRSRLSGDGVDRARPPPARSNPRLPAPPARHRQRRKKGFRGSPSPPEIVASQSVTYPGRGTQVLEQFRKANQKIDVYRAQRRNGDREAHDPAAGRRGRHKDHHDRRGQMPPEAFADGK